jgi:hypothetical protein
MVSLQIPKVEKDILELFAKSHGMSLSELFRKGARLLGAMKPGFLETIEKFYSERGIQIPIVLELGIQKQIAAQAAWKKVFGTVPPGIEREFKMQDGKLIRGDNLSKILEHEYSELFQTLKEKLMDSEDLGEAVEVTAEQFSEFAFML